MAVPCNHHVCNCSFDSTFPCVLSSVLNTEHRCIAVQLLLSALQNLLSQIAELKVFVSAGPHNPHMEARGVDGQGLTGESTPTLALSIYDSHVVDLAVCAQFHYCKHSCALKECAAQELVCSSSQVDFAEFG